MKFFFLFTLSILSFSGFCQVDNTPPPYKRFPGLPPVKILLGDSTSWFTKEQVPAKKDVLYMIFSPECSHCQHETEELVAHKQDFKNIQIVMVTMQPLWEMKDFIIKYKLNEMPNVVVGKDIYYTTPSFYNIHNLPFLAMYDTSGNVIRTFEGSMPIEKVLEAFNTASK